MSGDDQVNATTLLQGSRVLFLTQDGNQSVGLNSYVDAPTNAVMGLVIFDELNDPPNQTRISINNQGITETFANGSPTLNVSWSNFYLLKEATQALRLPATANILVANDTFEANDNNLAKTRIASMSAVASVNPQLTLKADTGGAVWEEADLTQNGLTWINNTGSSFTKSWYDIISSPSAPQDIASVLGVGTNAGGLNITNLNNVDLVSINSTSYPPPNTASLGDVMSVNNVASTNLNMNNWDIQNVNTINGLSPVVLGLQWSDFTGTNAFSNLPNQAYQVDSGGNNTSQYYDRFAVFNSATPSYTTINNAGMELLDVNSSTTTYYGSNNISSNNATAFTITAGASASQPLNLNCSSLVINGVAYSVPSPPPLRWGYYTNVGQSFSASSGTYTNVGVGSSPIQTLSGMTPSGSYTIAIQFNCWVDNADTTSSCYINYNNVNGSFQGLYDNGTPCPNTTAVGVYPYGSSTQFTIQDTIIFVAGNSGELYLDLYFGTSAGFSGNYKWSLSAQIISP
jgi:hypothetical protein